MPYKKFLCCQGFTQVSRNLEMLKGIQVLGRTIASRGMQLRVDKLIVVPVRMPLTGCMLCRTAVRPGGIICLVI